MLAVKHSPRVAKVLAKGQDITTSELNYLYARKVDIEEIATCTGYSEEEIREARRSIKKPSVRRQQKRKKERFELELEVYQKMRADKFTKKKIAEMHGIDVSVLRVWEIANGIIKADVKGLTKEKFIEYKKA